MAVEEYSNVTGLKKVKSRYGCSVCPKKVTNGTLIVNSSSINLLLNKKNVNHNDTNSKYLDNDKSKIKAIISEPKVNDCYCNHMEEIKKKLFPKVLCSKRFKIPVLDIDEDWLNEISKFRRENWFDCHSDTFTDAICLKNINSSNSLSNLIHNSNHLNDSILSNYSESNELKSEPIMSGERCTRVTHVKVKKKSTESKSTDKKKRAPNKPWIPPSFI